MAKQEELTLVGTPDTEPLRGPRKTTSVFTEAGWDVALRVGSIFGLVLRMVGDEPFLRQRRPWCQGRGKRSRK